MIRPTCVASGNYVYPRELNNAARPLRRSVRVAIAALKMRFIGIQRQTATRAGHRGVNQLARYYRRAL